MQKDDAAADPFCWLQEARLLFNIALPTVAVQFSIFFIYPQTASAVGRNLGTEELAGFSLASLTGNLSCLSIMMGILTAADTLMPRAFAAGNYKEIGDLAIRGYVSCALTLFIPLVLLSTAMDSIFYALGQDPTAAELATNWLRIYVLGVPFVLLLRITQRFLACQHIVWPMVCGAVVGCFLIHPFLLRLFVPSFGLEGSGLAIVLTQMTQTILVFLCLRWRPPHKADAWPGLSMSTIQEAVKLDPMVAFFKLSSGGLLSMSEWFFWEAVCFLAGRMGVVPLCIHSIAYNLIPIMFMIPLGLAIGLSVRIGHVLGESVKKAQLIAAGCMGFAITIALILAIVMYHFQSEIVGLFTDDEEVVQGCREIWLNVCLYIVLQFVFGINSGIMRALGLQWKMAAVLCIVLWCIALPTLLHVAIRNGGGVTAIWKCLPIFYVVLNALLTSIYSTADWQSISDSIQGKRRNLNEPVVSESTHLLAATNSK
jgi:multidrug resistance protein, MATE family